MGWVSYKTGADDTGLAWLASSICLRSQLLPLSSISHLSCLSSSLLPPLVFLRPRSSPSQKMRQIPTQCDSDSLLPNALAQVTWRCVTSPPALRARVGIPSTPANSTPTASSLLPNPRLYATR
ncbi:hypothetical protein ACEPAG_5948 [Sanghuangporus baumii]